MRIIASSDWHIGKRMWKDLNWGYKVAEQIVKICTIDDIFIFGGDLGEDYEHFMKGLEAMKPIRAHKLFYLGNNDLQTIQHSVLIRHYDELSERVAEAGFHLLDKEPRIIGSTGFVGNSGWYDGSLWRNLPNAPEKWNEYEKIDKEANAHFQNREFFRKLRREDYGHDDFWHHTSWRIGHQMKDLIKDPKVKKIVLGIHHVPSTDYVVYLTKDQLTSFEQKWNFLAFFMGADRLSHHYQLDKVVLGLTGHTHRSDNHQVGKVRVYNISSTPEKPYQAFEI